MEGNRVNQLGIYEKALNSKWSWEEKIKMAKQAKFDFIELSIDESDEKIARLDWSIEQIKRLSDLLFKYDLRINSICLSAHRRFPLGSTDPEKRSQALRIAERACWLAKNLGVRVIQVAAYDVYYEPSNPSTAFNFIRGMKKFLSFAKHYQVQLAFETMDREFAGTITRCLNLIKKIDSNQLFIYPDIGNLWRFSNDIESELEIGFSRIVACHFKDTLPQVFKEVEFGEGDVDFVTALKKLIILNFVGPFLIEMWSKNQSNESFEENLDLLIKARQFFEKNYKEAQKQLSLDLSQLEFMRVKDEW